MKAFNVFVAVLVVALSARAADVLTEKLQRGLFEEEANHNLDAAIKEYQSVVAQSDEQRKVIATALFRLGECYRKLGKTNEANAQYQRLLRDFSEQEQLVTLIPRQAAPVSGPGSTVPSWKTVSDPEQLRLLQEEIKLAEQQVAAVEKHHAAGVEPLASVLNAKRDVLAVRRLLPENSSLPRQRSLLNEQVKIVEQLLKESNERVKVGVVATTEPIPLRRELLTLQREMAGLTEGSAVSATAVPAQSGMTQAEAEELARVKSLVQNSPDLLNATYKDGMSPLPFAANAGFFEVASFLLNNGASPNGLSPNATPPLITAASRGHLRIVELLLEKGADINASASGGPTALMRACDMGFQGVAELLLKRGADVNRQNSNQETALHYAVYKGHTTLVELLLKRGAKTDVLFQEARKGSWSQFNYSQGATPLHLAANRGDAVIAGLLLKAGASAKATNQEGRTSLHIAAANGNTNICALLIDAGADLNAMTQDSGTPLTSAIGNTRTETVALLVARGADVNRIGIRSDQYAPFMLHLAVGREASPLLKALLAAKPSLEVTDWHGYTPVQFAMANNLGPMAELLLEAGADPNRSFGEGFTLLHNAVIGGRVSLVAALLKAKANPNVVNQHGETPLSLALASLRQNSPSRPVRNVPGFPGGGGLSLQSFPLNPNSPPAPTKPIFEEIASLLKVNGADEFLQRRGFISAVRGAQDRVNIFSKGTNDLNRYTLMEFLAAVYEQGGQDFPFPDLEKITIHRLEGKTMKPLLVNAAKMLAVTNDCSGDMPLEWGDNVDIPMADHPVTAQWSWLKGPESATLWNCLQREVRIAAGGTNVSIPMFLSRGQSLRSPFFRLSSVVLRDNRFRNLLRSSSDLSRVTVTRTDPQTKEAKKMTFDLNAVALPDMSYSSSAPPIPWQHDLWLRDGDVIEIPEKQ